jgi:hypothetical protein
VLRFLEEKNTLNPAEKAFLKRIPKLHLDNKTKEIQTQKKSFFLRLQPNTMHVIVVFVVVVVVHITVTETHNQFY